MEQTKHYNIPILDMLLTTYFGLALSLIHFMIMKSLFSFLSLPFIAISVITGLIFVVLSFFSYNKQKLRSNIKDFYTSRC